MTDTHQFNLVTLNAFGVPTVRTRTRLRSLARELNDRALHVVCLQEVQMHRYVPIFNEGLTNFPYASWEPYLYAPKGGLMTLSREAQESAAFLPFKARGWLLGPTIADWMLFKGMLITRLTHRRVPITVINTHLAANYSGNWSPSNRYAKLEALQLTQLAEVVRREDPRQLVIVAGDFNIPRYSWLYHEFLERSGLHDPLGDQQEPTYRPDSRLPAAFSAMLNVAIDHALVRLPPGLEATLTSTIILKDKVELLDGRTAHLSDHYGIHLRIEWPRGEAE